MRDNRYSSDMAVVGIELTRQESRQLLRVLKKSLDMLGPDKFCKELMSLINQQLKDAV